MHECRVPDDDADERARRHDLPVVRRLARCDLHHRDAEREQGVDDLIALVGAVDGICLAQAAADAGYFLRHAGHTFSPAEADAVHDRLRAAYRWQSIATGVQEPRFAEVMKALVTPAQLQRIGQALGPIVEHAGQ